MLVLEEVDVFELDVVGSVLDVVGSVEEEVVEDVDVLVLVDKDVEVVASSMATPRARTLWPASASHTRADASWIEYRGSAIDVFLASGSHRAMVTLGMSPSVAGRVKVPFSTMAPSSTEGCQLRVSTPVMRTACDRVLTCLSARAARTLLWRAHAVAVPQTCCCASVATPLRVRSQYAYMSPAPRSSREAQ